MKKITLLILGMLLTLGTMAQGYQGQGPQGKNAQGSRPRFSKEEFRQQMQKFIIHEAKLTEQEAQVFFPIFHEYKNAQRQVHMKIHKLKTTAPTAGDDKAYQEQLLQMAKLNAEMAGLDSIYYKKLFKVISAEKLYKVLSIEDRMSRNILQNYNRRPENGKRR